MDSKRRNQPSGQAEPVVIGDGPAGVGSGVEGFAHDAALEERISRRAYQRFEERGGEHGRDMDDWLEAERELREAERDA